MFRKPTNLSLIALLSPVLACAETAGDYLHRGAQKYIFGDEEKAKQEIVTGLQKFPQDQPLQQMLTLFREQEKKQQEQQQNEQQQDKKDEEKKKEEQQKQNQSQQDQQQQQKQDGQEQKDAQSQPQQNGEQKQGKDGESGEAKDGKDGQKPEQMPGQEDRKLSGDVKANNPTPAQQQQEQEAAEAQAEQEAAAEGKMTERQAKALLESLRGDDEKVRLLDPNERKRAGRVLRDW